MKVKTSELTGRALDLAVAKAKGLDVQFHDTWMREEWMRRGYPDRAYDEHIGFQTYRGQWVIVATVKVEQQLGGEVVFTRPEPIPNYSTNWAQVGPLIDQEKITIRINALVPGLPWVAFIDFGGSNCNIKARQSGPTALIAACRCFVASRLGDTVDIPEELL